MDPDKRIVPEKHISYLLEEDTVSERTIEVKRLLHSSPDKIHRVAHTWMGHSGLNPLARVIIHHIPEVPRKKHPAPHHTPEETKHHQIEHHDALSIHQEIQEHALHGGHHTHGEHHGHTSHDHGEHHGGGHNHGHSGGEHHGGTFSSFISTGHWFGDQGAYIFSMLGRIVGEIIGYLFKTLAVAIIFGPTRTALLIVLIGILLNTAMDVQLPVGISAGIAGIIHLIFTSINKIGGGHGESHGSETHGHGGGHAGGHGHH